MALFVRQNEERSKLQERLAAELQERLKSAQLDTTQTNTIENSNYLKDTKTATVPNFAWVLFALLALAIVGFFAWQATTQ